MVRPYLSFGSPVPADFFVLSVGEPPSRDCTKIGGLPFWPRDREWPQSGAGRACPFSLSSVFANRSTSWAPSPRRMLLLFGDKDVPSSLVAKWQSLTCRTRLLDFNELPVKPATPSFYGARWRAENYPDAKYGDPIVLADETTVSEVWFVCQLLGMQIGGHPYFPGSSGRPQKTERVVCSMSAVFPIPGLPWPFVNHPSPLTTREAAQLTFDLSED